MAPQFHTSYASKQVYGPVKVSKPNCTWKPHIKVEPGSES